MDEYRYESLLDENASLKKALASTKHILERTINDYETLKQIHEDYKHQYERLRQENEETNSKYLQVAAEKKEIENHFDSTIRNFKIAIEQKQKELEDVQAKVIPTLDHDMMRIKIINELEMPHRQALESKQAEVDKLQDQIYEFKRQNDILNTKFESLRYEAEKDIKDLKERHKLEMSDLMLEIQTLQDRVDDTKDREVIRSIRKELDDYKIKYEESEQEINEISDEKDRLREEKNEILLKFNKQIEVERADRRAAKAEADKSHVRVRQLEMEIQNLQNKVLDKEKDNQQITIDTQRLQDEFDQKMKQIAGLQQQIATLEESQVFNQSKWQDYITRQQMTQHEKQLTEKNRINELQRELEKYQKMIVDLENKNRNLNFQTLKDVDNLRAENQRLTETVHAHQRTVEQRENEVKQVKFELQKLQDEIVNMQRINRELQSYKENYQLNNTLAQQQLQQLQQQLQLQQTQQQTQQQPQQQQQQEKYVAAQPEDNRRNAGLANSLSEALAREQKYKMKISRLKQKLRKANEKIMELLPYKLGNNAETDEILKKYRAGGYGDEHEYTAPVSYQLPGEGPDVIRELKKKYGFTSYADQGVADNYIHTGNLPKRDEYEHAYGQTRGIAEKYDIEPNRSAAATGFAVEHGRTGFRDEPARSATGFRQEAGRSAVAFRDEPRGFAPEDSMGSVNYDEIKRFAEDEAIKYRGFA